MSTPAVHHPSTMDVATAELLGQSLRRALRSEDTEAVDAALDEVGWRDALLAEGTPVVALLFAEQGAANATSGALDDLLTAALGLPPAADTAFVLPAFRQHAAPGRASGGGLTIRGIGTARVSRAGRAVVVAADGDGHRAAAIATEHLRVQPVVGVDPRLGLVLVEGDDIAATGWSAAVTADWPQLLAVGQLALAYELIGASRTMLRLAREHALTRIQFGAPIGSFQAVRHRLAESLLAIETADAAVTAAIESAGPLLPAPVSPLLAGMAKALAGRGGRTVARHCQQVLAGVGFTAEHEFHHSFRRVLTLDGLLGDARTLTRELGEELLRTRRMPVATPL
jgi:alkylation response protein AidB-like acyl-CoA dehydrogenase